MRSEETKNKSDSRANIIDSKNGKGLQVVHSEEHDDTPLPSPQDLQEYHFYLSEFKGIYNHASHILVINSK
ncbi:MAG: hypothetical protein M9958_00405 [Chitinophagales bacterium]|nr:hypothetical protein [Chitinophagales bacterium]